MLSHNEEIESIVVVWSRVRWFGVVFVAQTPSRSLMIRKKAAFARVY